LVSWRCLFFFLALAMVVSWGDSRHASSHRVTGCGRRRRPLCVDFRSNTRRGAQGRTPRRNPVFIDSRYMSPLRSYSCLSVDHVNLSNLTYYLMNSLDFMFSKIGQKSRSRKCLVIWHYVLYWVRYRR
jgi:hypothetical protein